MKRAAVVLAAALVLSGCQPRERAPAADSSPADSLRTPPPSAGPAAIDSTGEAGAIDVLRRYYAAIDGRNYAAAYGLWTQDGAASGQSFHAFARGFAETGHSTVEITGPVTSEGAAGSIYATVPVRVHATTRDGADQHFAGTYVLRRVNDVPGAKPAQLRWHIHSARLEPVP
jgi:hypothetical protein